MKTAKSNSLAFHSLARMLAFSDLFDALEGVYGDEAQSYMRQYLKLWPGVSQATRKRSEGENFAAHFGRRPLLIIDR
jgi:hypothetical protein